MMYEDLLNEEKQLRGITSVAAFHSLRENVALKEFRLNKKISLI